MMPYELSSDAVIAAVDDPDVPTLLDGGELLEDPNENPRDTLLVLIVEFRVLSRNPQLSKILSWNYLLGRLI